MQLSTNGGVILKTIAARELKRRGIGAFDELLEEGPVYVIQNDRPQYVLMTAQHFEDLVDDQHEAEIARIKASEEEVRAGKTRRVPAQELIDQYDLRD